MWFTARVPCDEYAGPSWAIRAKGLAHKGSYIILSAGFTWGPCGLALFSPAVTQMLPICFPYQCGLAQLFPSSFPCQPLQPVSFPHPTQLPRCFPALSQMFPRSIPDLSQVFPRSIPGVSQVYPSCFPGLSQVYPRCFPGLSQMYPTCFPFVSHTIPAFYPVNPYSKFLPSSADLFLSSRLQGLFNTCILIEI